MPDTINLVVCGAHMRDLPLNRQLLELDAEFVEATQTAPEYRFYALPGEPRRPGLVRVADNGYAIAVEIWRLPQANLGRFIVQIPSPLCLGTVKLADGRGEIGFLCESVAVADAEEISELGGWRDYLTST